MVDYLTKKVIDQWVQDNKPEVALKAREFVIDYIRNNDVKYYVEL